MKPHKLNHTYISPNFDDIPIALKQIKRWVVWKDKIPYDAQAVNSFASVKDPFSWTSFDKAVTAFEEGGWDGVGFIFNGDGIVAVDLDNCVINGKPSPESLAIMEEIGCEYIEISPSGTGLHGFGYAEDAPATGLKSNYKGTSVELYSTKRHMTVTGLIIKDGGLVNLHGYTKVYRYIRAALPTEETDATEETESVSSVGKYQFPQSTIPTATSQRNKKLFALARDLKGKHPNKTAKELMPIVKEWHQQNIANIGTKDFAITRVDFENCWANVKHPSTFILEEIKKNLPKKFNSIAQEEYGDIGGLLFYICLTLQKLAGDEPFFISCRTAGELLEIHYTDAANLLNVFVRNGWLLLISKGSTRRASRYRIANSLCNKHVQS